VADPGGWQGGHPDLARDLLSAPTLAVTRGIERVAFGNLMMREIRKSIESFKKDIAAAP